MIPALPMEVEISESLGSICNSILGEDTLNVHNCAWQGTMPMWIIEQISQAAIKALGSSKIDL